MGDVRRNFKAYVAAMQGQGSPEQRLAHASRMTRALEGYRRAGG